jgi:hypothetical protein
MVISFGNPYMLPLLDRLRFILEVWLFAPGAQEPVAGHGNGFFVVNLDY